MVDNTKDLGFTKEEELLLQDFSRNVSTKSNVLFYGSAFIVSAVPICKYSAMAPGGNVFTKECFIP